MYVLDFKQIKRIIFGTAIVTVAAVHYGKDYLRLKKEELIRKASVC